jgi:hypothetical protein
MLALAHHIERAIVVGSFRSESDAARALGVSSVRVKLLLDLLLLPPEVQEKALFMDCDGVNPE